MTNRVEGDMLETRLTLSVPASVYTSSLNLTSALLLYLMRPTWTSLVPMTRLSTTVFMNERTCPQLLILPDESTTNTRSTCWHTSETCAGKRVRIKSTHIVHGKNQTSSIKIRHPASKSGIQHQNQASSIKIRHPASKSGIQHHNRASSIKIRHSASNPGIQHQKQASGIKIRHPASESGIQHQNLAFSIKSRHPAS